MSRRAGRARERVPQANTASSDSFLWDESSLASVPGEARRWRVAEGSDGMIRRANSCSCRLQGQVGDASRDRFLILRSLVAGWLASGRIRSRGAAGKSCCCLKASPTASPRTTWRSSFGTLARRGTAGAIASRRVASRLLCERLPSPTQALCSYIRGSLTTKALLQGLGVGESSATALGASSQFFWRDLCGRAGSIAFAVAAGSGLDGNAKQWRFFADCTNNVVSLPASGITAFS